MTRDSRITSTLISPGYCSSFSERFGDVVMIEQKSVPPAYLRRRDKCSRLRPVRRLAHLEFGLGMRADELRDLLGVLIEEASPMTDALDDRPQH